jgi:hypothetical protein
MKNYFKLGFRNKSAAAQLGICERVVANLAAKPELLKDPDRLTEASEAVTALRSSHDRILNLRGQLKSEIVRRNQLLRVARDKVKNAGFNAAYAAQFERAKMVEAGLELPRPLNVPVGKPATPDYLSGEPTDKEGEARLRWKRPVRRCWFEIEYCLDVVLGDWKLVDSSPRQSCVVEGMVSGEKYWFRIRALNSHGESPWSQPVAVRVR